MGQRAVTTMTVGEFFVWQEEQDGLYELVDGYPLQMMSGAKRQHDRVTINLIVAVDRKLQGKPCQSSTQDTGIRISNTQIRRPDLAIDCGKFDPESYVADEPRAVFEVLSPSTRGFDQSKKLEEYKTIKSLQHIVLIDPNNPEVIAYQRAANGVWETHRFGGLEAAIEFADLGIELPMKEIYRNVNFLPRPVLVVEE